MTAQLTVKNFSKQFRSHWTFQPIRAVDDVSFEVDAGEAFGFIGHNGAGKTTTIKSIVGLIKPSSGSIDFEGKSLADSRGRVSIGYLPELPYFYDHLTVHETLTFFASLYGQSRFEEINSSIPKAVSEVIDLLGLGEKRGASLKSLSKGLQQRVGFAQAIIHKPNLLLLDEPFSGLDPLGRIEFRNIILELNRAGTTIFLSSHILSDVETICNRVAIMARGRLRQVISPGELAAKFGQKFELAVETAEPSFLQRFAEKSTIRQEISPDKKSITRFIFQDYDTARLALSSTDAKTRIVEFKTVSATLEEVFLKITEESRGSPQA